MEAAQLFPPDIARQPGVFGPEKECDPGAPLEDQLVAGLVMFGLGNLIYFAAIWVIFFRLDDKRATAGDRPMVEVESPATMRQ